MQAARAHLGVAGPRRALAPLALAAAVASTGGLACRTTTDSLGYDDASGIVLHRMKGPAVYPNSFRDLLGKTDAEIAARIEAAFQHVFHGDPLTEAIYFSTGTDQAYIQDTLHGDIRTEGIGLGMIVAVELDKRDEFDRLWRWAKANRRIASGAGAGYFGSFCDVEAGTIPCVDPYGYQQITMALLLAHDRWGSPSAGGADAGAGGAAGGATDAGTAPAPVDYGAEARALLHVMRHKEDDNGGVVDGVTNTFDARTRLAADFPDVTTAGQSRPSVQMPAYWELWTQATADRYWTRAAAAARDYWARAANPTTGLMPLRAFFDGTPVPGSDVFESEAYRAQLALAVDLAWFARDPWEVEESDRLIRFFLSQGIATYGRSFSLDGTTVLDPLHDGALVATNAMTAQGATGLTPAERSAFVNALWIADLPTGPARYYTSLLQLTGLLVLGGQFRVY